VLSVEAADRIGVFGQTGTGKTEYVKRELLTPLLASNVRVLALDVKDELSIRGRPRGNTAVGPLPYRWTASQVAYQPEVLADPALRLAVVPDELTPKKCARAFKLLAQSLKFLAEDGHRLRTVLVLEETQFWARHEEDLLEAVATMWRDYDVSLVLVSQRAVGVPISARAQLNQLVSFAQTEPADIEAIRLRTQLSDPTFHERVALLRPREFQLWRAGVLKNGERFQQREGSDRQSVHDQQPHQDGVRGDGDALRLQQGEQGDGPEVVDLEIRGSGRSEGEAEDGVKQPLDESPAAARAPVKQATPTVRKKRAPRKSAAQPPTQTPTQKRKSRRRSRTKPAA
jgi:hypothetical protein